MPRSDWASEAGEAEEVELQEEAEEAAAAEGGGRYGRDEYSSYVQAGHWEGGRQTRAKGPRRSRLLETGCQLETEHAVKDHVEADDPIGGMNA